MRQKQEITSTLNRSSLIIVMLKMLFSVLSTALLQSKITVQTGALLQQDVNCLTSKTVIPNIQLFQKTLSKEKQTSHKPRPQGSMGSFKSVFIAAVKGELKKPLRRRRG